MSSLPDTMAGERVGSFVARRVLPDFDHHGGLGLVLGLPATIEDCDAALMHRFAKWTLTNAVQIPAIVAVELLGESTAPFWDKQLSWSDGRYLARSGHRYRSVHGLCRANERYDTYQKTLQPQLATWLDINAQAFSEEADQQIVDRVGFGYANTFDFDAEDFDISRFFKLNFSFDIGTETGLLKFENRFSFIDEESRAWVSIEIAAEGPLEYEAQVRVITKVFASLQSDADRSFAETEAISAMIVEAKEVAKRVFFDFATEETHTLMGAVYEEKADADAASGQA